MTFTGSGPLFAISSGNLDPNYGLGDGTVLSFQGAQPSVLTVALPTGTTALGFDFGASPGVPFAFAVNGQTYTYNSATTGTSSPTFFGATSVAPITSLTVTANGDFAQIDRFSFGSAVTASAVPEPSEYAAMGAAGLSLCGLMVRAKRKAVKKAATRTTPTA